MKYYYVTDMITKDIKLVDSIDKLSEITGYAATCFTLMKGNETYYISHYRVSCIEEKVIGYYNDLGNKDK